jgi:hypothetical protein
MFNRVVVHMNKTLSTISSLDRTQTEPSSRLSRNDNNDDKKEWKKIVS